MEHKPQVLSRYATGDDSFPAAAADTWFAVLDPKADALVRVTALVALGAPDAPFRRAVARALEAGVTPEGIVEALMNVSAIIGIARVVSAAPAIARAIGCSVDAALLA